MFNEIPVFQINDQLQYQSTQNQNIPNCELLQNLQETLINNFSSIPDKLMKTGLHISSSNIPPHTKSDLIQNMVFNTKESQNYQQNQLVFPQINLHMNNSTNKFENLSMDIKNITKSLSGQRVLFRKEEDERIKKLVGIFGTSHWNIIAQFMEGRTAKQCRDRYTNYLKPGVLEGK